MGGPADAAPLRIHCVRNAETRTESQLLNEMKRELSLFSSADSGDAQ